MTLLGKPLRRLVEAYGQQIVVEIIPSDAGIPAYIKLRMKGQHKSYKSILIEPPAATGVELGFGGGGR
jgi:hypothetical protein